MSTSGQEGTGFATPLICCEHYTRYFFYCTIFFADFIQDFFTRQSGKKRYRVGTVSGIMPCSRMSLIRMKRLVNGIDNTYQVSRIGAYIIEAII
jgi:hypothetical protein